MMQKETERCVYFESCFPISGAASTKAVTFQIFPNLFLFSLYFYKGVILKQIALMSEFLEEIDKN